MKSYDYWLRVQCYFGFGFFFVFCVILRGFGLFCGVRVRIGVLRFRNEVQGILV